MPTWGAGREPIAFLALVLTALIVGCYLEGRLPWVFMGPPLSVLATLGCLGSGTPLIFLRLALGYEGTIEAPGFEYGSAFILTAWSDEPAVGARCLGYCNRAEGITTMSHLLLLVHSMRL